MDWDCLINWEGTRIGFARGDRWRCLVRGEKGDSMRYVRLIFEGEDLAQEPMRLAYRLIYWDEGTENVRKVATTAKSLRHSLIR